MTDILVVGEILDGDLRVNTLNAVRFAQQVAEASGGAYDILVVGDGADAAAETAAKYGARKVLKCQIDGGYLAERHAATIAQTAEDGGYGVLAATAVAVPASGRRGEGARDAARVSGVAVPSASIAPCQRCNV